MSKLRKGDRVEWLNDDGVPEFVGTIEKTSSLPGWWYVRGVCLPAPALQSEVASEEFIAILEDKRLRGVQS